MKQNKQTGTKISMLLFNIQYMGWLCYKTNNEVTGYMYGTDHEETNIIYLIAYQGKINHEALHRKQANINK